MVSAIVLAAGAGVRAGLEKNKVLTEYMGITVLGRTLSAIDGSEIVSEIVVAAAKEEEEEIKKILNETGIKKPTKIVSGGKTRTESVRNALAACRGEIVVIHDGARPFASSELFTRAARKAEEVGSAVAAIPSRDTVADCRGEIIERAYKGGAYIVQTPQAFSAEKIKFDYSQIPEGVSYPDDSAVYAAYCEPPHIVSGERGNIKLTYPEDFKEPFRVGCGFDLHKLAEGRKLVLGGVVVPHEKGLLGHSDADVLTHAVMDALLSALSLRDIGYHFPDTDPAYEGANSMELLARVMEMIKERGYSVSNLSAVIMAEKPKLSPFVPKITATLAAALNVQTTNVGITCTTLEKVGTVGREEAIASQATVLLRLTQK